MTNRTLHALVIDDEQSVRDFVCTVLESDGWTVSRAASAEAAFEMLTYEKWQAVFCDVMLGVTPANTVGEYDATTGATINAAFINGQGLHNPHVLLFDSLGHLLVGDNYDTPTVGMYDATTGATINAGFVPGIGFGGTWAMALDGSNHLFVSNYINRVGEYDATTGASIKDDFITGLQDINGLAFVDRKSVV